MRILFLSPRQSWPPTSGAKLRDYHLARALGSQSELTYVYYAEPGLAKPTTTDMPFCRQVIGIPRARGYTPVKLVTGLAGRWSLPVVNYTSADVVQAIGRCFAEAKYDLVHCDSIHVAACIEAVGRAMNGIPCFYNWHNIESELMQRYSIAADSAARRLYARLTERRLRNDEDRILGSADGHIVCSEREKLQLSARAPQARVAVIENGVDAAGFAQGSNSAVPRNRLLFVGSMSYHANSDAAVWFTREIWPGIRQRFPQWRLTLVGSEPGPQVKALAELPGVEVTGTVSEVQPYYQEAIAALVPIRVGGGTRLKILEAMAAGVPVVSTSLGAEGIPVSHGRDILIADRPEEWVEMLVSLQEGKRAEQLAEAGRSLVASRYDWNAIGKTLLDTYREWLLG